MVEEMVWRIVEAPAKNDFINFSIRHSEPISEHREYNGVRVNMIGSIKNSRTPFSLDFGFGDVVIPKPLMRSLSVLLPDFDRQRSCQ